MSKQKKQPLSVTHSELATQWHPTKNGDLKPEDVVAGSHKKVWWKCPEGPDHEWDARIAHRSKGIGCPCCAGKTVSVTNSLATLYPELAAQWHPTKNGDLKPEDVVAGSSKKVWWKCPEGPDHEWPASSNSRTNSSSGHRCGFCSGKRVSVTNSLATQYPEVAAEWHPTKNGELTPEDVVAGSNKKVWWKCPEGPDHEWNTSPDARTSKGTGCSSCARYQVSVTNSLATLYPDVAAEWHPTKNGDLKPEDVTAGSGKKFWWKCPEGPDHEWDASPNDRTSKGTGCSSCAGYQVSVTNSLATLYPEVAAEWHPTKNGDLTPEDVVVGSNKKVWWKCPKGPDHEWDTSPNARTSKGTGCRSCAGKKVSVTNSLATLYPDVAAQWHPTKNGDLTPEDVVAGSNKKVWWKCPEGPDHEWQVPIGDRTTGHGCSFCAGRQVSVTNSLATLYPEVAAQWHPTKNGDLTPEDVVAGSHKKVWWKCPEGPDHEWPASLSKRTSGGGCSSCAGYQVSVTNSLATQYPEVAAQWHPTKNGDLTPEDVVAGSNKKVWWKCPEGPDHEWQALIVNRRQRGCPICNSGWTIENIRRFVKSLCDQNLLDSLSPAELFLLAQQNGLIAFANRRAEFVKALTSGRLPKDDLEKFAAGDESSIEGLFDDQTAEALTEGLAGDVGDADADREMSDDELTAETETRLPEVSAGSILDSVESDLWTTVDAEAIEFLVASGVAKLWRLAYDPERLDAAKIDTGTPREVEYSERIRRRFREQLDAAESLVIPDDYDFHIDGELIMPNLMQRHVASQVASERRCGNWSGTGAGKTLSAVIASMVIGSKLSVVLCPNSVIKNGWVRTIKNAFPAARIATKTLTPTWPDGDGPRYLILNYETLQQPNSESELAKFLKGNRVDMVVIDEIHYAKQRTDEASKRRRLTEALCATASETNPALAVLGMSATPVINNLREGVSMVELVTGVKHDDLNIKATVNNCLKIHQRLVLLGTRWMPPYPEFGKENPRVDVSDAVDEIRELPKGTAGLLQFEQILVREKLDCILEHVEDGTVIYTEYVEGIVNDLTTALTNAGWKVGRYTGQDKTGLDPFIAGELNVLIGSSAVGTGVDGLQHRANKLIIACSPWTAAAYEQLVGRLVRQGQQRPVEVVFPVTFANVGDDEWSWCQSRLNRIEHKKSIADAAVDGIVPTGHLRSPADAFRDALGWLERLDCGVVTHIQRERIVVPLSDDPMDVKRRFTQYGDFSQLNYRWNATGSAKLHERLKEDTQEWANYHTLYRQARSDWVVVPFQKITTWIKQLPQNRIVADFGCGEDLLGGELRESGYQVHSFDHVAINDEVVVADVGSGVPLDDNEIDVAVFSLSMMGANTGDYLREAARVLVFDGRLIVCEATTRLPEKEVITERLRRLGFNVTDITEEAQFTFIQAVRTDHEPELGISLV